MRISHLQQASSTFATHATTKADPVQMGTSAHSLFCSHCLNSGNHPFRHSLSSCFRLADTLESLRLTGADAISYLEQQLKGQQAELVARGLPIPTAEKSTSACLLAVLAPKPARTRHATEPYTPHGQKRRLTTSSHPDPATDPGSKTTQDHPA